MIVEKGHVLTLSEKLGGSKPRKVKQEANKDNSSVCPSIASTSCSTVSTQSSKQSSLSMVPTSSIQKQKPRYGATLGHEKKSGDGVIHSFESVNKNPQTRISSGMSKSISNLDDHDISLHPNSNEKDISEYDSRGESGGIQANKSEFFRITGEKKVDSAPKKPLFNRSYGSLDFDLKSEAYLVDDSSFSEHGPNSNWWNNSPSKHGQQSILSMKEDSEKFQLVLEPEPGQQKENDCLFDIANDRKEVAQKWPEVDKLECVISKSSEQEAENFIIESDLRSNDVSPAVDKGGQIAVEESMTSKTSSDDSRKEPDQSSLKETQASVRRSSRRSSVSEKSQREIKEVKKKDKTSSTRKSSSGTIRISLKVTDGVIDLSALDDSDPAQAAKLREAYEKWKKAQDENKAREIAVFGVDESLVTTKSPSSSKHRSQSKGPSSSRSRSSSRISLLDGADDDDDNRRRSRLETSRKMENTDNLGRRVSSSVLPSNEGDYRGSDTGEDICKRRSLKKTKSFESSSSRRSDDKSRGRSVGRKSKSEQSAAEDEVSKENHRSKSLSHGLKKLSTKDDEAVSPESQRTTTPLQDKKNASVITSKVSNPRRRCHSLGRNLHQSSSNIEFSSDDVSDDENVIKIVTTTEEPKSSSCTVQSRLARRGSSDNMQSSGGQGRRLSTSTGDNLDDGQVSTMLAKPQPRTKSVVKRRIEPGDQRREKDADEASNIRSKSTGRARSTGRSRLSNRNRDEPSKDRAKELSKSIPWEAFLQEAEKSSKALCADG